MSTSLLYHGWGLKGYRHVRSHYGDGKLIFTVQPNTRSLTCPVCHGRDILHHGSIYRMWREVSIGSKPVFIQMSIPRADDANPSRVVDLDLSAHHTYHYWDAYEAVIASQLYGFRVHGSAIESVAP